MKCYYHHDRDAFGICRSCGKALCLECMSHDFAHVVCGGSKDCIDREIQNEKFYQNANVVYSAKSIAKTKLCGFVMLVLGLFLTILSIFSDKFDFGLLLLGVLFMCIGGPLIKRSNEFVPTEKGENSKTVGTKFYRYIWILLVICVVVFILSLFLG